MKTTTRVARPISRRRVLTGLGLVTVAGAGTGVLRAIATEKDVPVEVVGRRPPGFGPGRWWDPRSWPDGRVPGPDDVAVVTRPIVIDGDTKVAGVRVERNGALIFSPHDVTLLESTGNVVVAGQLVMRPASAAVEHTLRFVGIDESRFQGGGHGVVDTDTGLWVVEHGLLDAQGAPRTGWLRLSGDALAGDSVLRLERAPEGWIAGDLIAIAPSAESDGTKASEAALFAFEERRIVHIDGDHITLDAKLTFDHPGLYHAGLSTPLTAEVANLTRNVRIEGTDSGRAHILLPGTHEPQMIRHVAIRHVGPPRRDGTIILGRYGLHLHMCRDGSRGSEVEGVVIRDCGNRAFVAHGSHGVTFRDCVGYNVAEEVFWWDHEDHRFDYPKNATFDVRYERCAAMNVTPWGWKAHTLAAFDLAQGEGNACVDSVAVAVVGGKNASGFHWPSGANLQPNRWLFEDCVAHNNDSHGIFVWQNGQSRDHVIDRFVGYRNTGAGVNHGAYRNSYRYRDSLLVANGDPRKVSGTQLEQHANASWNVDTDTPSGYERVVFDAEGKSRACITTKATNGGFVEPLEFVDCTFLGAPHVLDLDEKQGSAESGYYHLHFVRVSVGGERREMRPSDITVTHAENGTIVRVQRRNGTAWQRNADGTVIEIAPFHED